MKIEDFAKLTLERINAEQQLIQNRLSWMLAFEGFLFASISVAIKEGIPASYSIFFNILIPSLGLLTAIFSLLGIHGANNAITEIKNKWEYREAFEKETTKKCPPMYGSSKLLGRAPSYGIPTIIAFCWAIFLYSVSPLYLQMSVKLTTILSEAEVRLRVTYYAKNHLYRLKI